MNCLPENFCVAPFIQLTTHPTGSFSPCPYLGGTVWKKQYPNIIEQWRSEDLEQLRNDFVNNKQNPICNRCWHEEKHGKRSLRKRLYDPQSGNSDYEVINQNLLIDQLVDGLTEKKYLADIKILTIKNGNLCNAKCRICHPGDSSRWAIEDTNKLKQITGKTFYSIDQPERNWTDRQIEEIFSLTQNLSRLELFGGEPFYNKKVMALLNQMVDSGRAKNISLYVNTNGSVDFTQKNECLAYFREVEIGVSLDDLNDRFNYQRHGLNYDTVINNIRTWQKFFESHGTKYFIDSITTVSAFNIWHLPEIKKAVTQILPQAPYWNLLVNPDFLSVKNLPLEFKQEVVAKLNQDPAEFSDLINVIQQPQDTEAWAKFQTVTQGLDHIRKENIKLIFPELARHL